MRKILFLALFLASFAFYTNTFASTAFQYPLPQISASSCRFTNWNNLSDNCKISLPKITGANYAAFKDNTTYERIYAVLYSATYNYGWDV